LKFECDFVVRHDNGGLEVEEIRAFEAPDLPTAIERVETMLTDEPSVVHKANTVQIRQGNIVKWSRAV
jgi:hypothetical protein